MCPTELAHLQARAPYCDHVSRLQSGPLFGCGEGEKVSIDDVRIWYKWLNQPLSPGEMCAGWLQNQTHPGRGGQIQQKCTPPQPFMSSALQLHPHSLPPSQVSEEVEAGILLHLWL